MFLFSLILAVSLLSLGTLDLLAPPTSSYNIEEIVSQVNLQFCSIVEIGESHCSLFLEFRSSPMTTQLSGENVAELYLGTCECSTLRNWDFCSIPLRKARPYECSFEEALPVVNSSARVHRRLCDPTMMVAVNEPCDCTKQLAQRTQYPVQGFLTCYKAPMPKSICSTHSVCGVSLCAAKSIFGLAFIQCEPKCKGRQPFCEDPSEVTSKAVVVTSVWSDWTPARRDEEGLQVDDAICLEENTHAPAFDCLGPGSYCCPKESNMCKCEVTTTMAEMKVTRYIGQAHTIDRRGFIQKKFKELTDSLKLANSRITERNGGHLNYSLVYGAQPNKSRRIVVYQPQKDCKPDKSSLP